MQGRQFLDLAREVASGPTEVHWRGTAIHAYYALVLECREALIRWGFTIPRHKNMHAYVRLRFAYATDRDLKQIADGLDELVRFRNQASYDLRSSVPVASPVVAQQLLQKATDGLALLDAVDGDPVRRAAAVASITP